MATTSAAGAPSPTVPTAGRRLAGFAVAVVFGHHVGTLFAPLGDAGADTRWADWIDLVVPLCVLGAAAAVLAVAGATPLQWLVFGVGALLYTQGHGLHLAANSVSNADPSDVAHLWDESVSHYPWYGGLTLVVVALGLALVDDRVRVAAPAWLLVGLFGLTWATNSIEGGTAWFGLAVAAGLAAWGWWSRGGGARLIAVAYSVALIALAGWGIWHGGFPQFSELGWI